MEVQNEFSMELLEQLARMSRIAMTEEEKQFYFDQLTSVIAYASVLPRSVPETDGAEADAVQGLEDLREDQPAPCLSQAAVLEMAAQKENGFFAVPRTVEG